MADVFDVAQFILDTQGEMTAMKLQKLVYYAQAWHTVWADSTLFPEPIEAWKDGPVCPLLWREHASAFRVKKLSRGNPDNLTQREKRTVRQVLEYYGDRSAQWLSDLTHSEDPWLEARGGAKPGARCNSEISPRSMSEYYSAL